MEALERRDLLTTAEGDIFSLFTTLSGAEVGDDLSAAIDWGDGASGIGTVSGSGAGPLQVRIDYSLEDPDTPFFDTQDKKDLLELAANMVVSRLGDQLKAITPGGGNSWSVTLIHPTTGVPNFEISNPSVAANELVIYVGGRALGSSLGVGGPGGSSATCVTAEFCSDVSTRGQAGAAAEPPTDLGPWGGSLSFNTATNWHFGETTTGLDNDESDFLSVAIHEVTHLLGFGASLAWNGLAAGGFFTGASAAAANGGSNVPLGTGDGHWEDGTTYNGQEAAMDPSLTDGTRKLVTPLDLAALDDIGWELVDTQLTVTAAHTYADDGEYTVDVVVTDSLGSSVSTSVTETVTNVDPSVTTPGHGTVLVGQTVSFTNIGLFTDPGFGSSESFTYTVDWDDESADTTGSPTIDQSGSPGIPTSGSFDATHTFSSTGMYTVSVTVADDDFGTGVDSFQVTVLDVSWHNSVNAFDVNGDSAVSAIDALVVINDLNALGSRTLPPPTTNDIPPFIDVTDDGAVSPLDALQVINFVNDQAGTGEGEADALGPADASLLKNLRPGTKVKQRAPAISRRTLADGASFHVFRELGRARVTQHEAERRAFPRSNGEALLSSFDSRLMCDLERFIDSLVRV